MRSARHVLCAATVAALALGGLTACNDLDLAVLPTAAHATAAGPSSATPAATSGAPRPAAGPSSARSTVASGAVTGAVAGSTAAATSRTHAASPSATSTKRTPKPTTPKPTTPKPTTTKTATPSTKPADSSVAGQVLGLVNAQRATAGCRPVTLDGRLTAAAAGHAQDMAANDYFSHTSKDGRTFVDRIQAQGYPAPRSENIAAGQPTVAAVMGAWMASSGHRANILDCSATQMGAASAKGGSFGIYWVQDFGRG